MNQFEDRSSTARHGHGVHPGGHPGYSDGYRGGDSGEGPGVSYVVGMPVAYPVSDGGGVMMVNGVPQPLSRRMSRIVLAAIIFATCVLPLIILAVVHGECRCRGGGPLALRRA